MTLHRDLQEQQQWWSGETLSSLPLMNTPKSQPSAEQQLSMRKTGTYQKRSTTKDIKKEPQGVGEEVWTRDIIKFHTPWVEDPQIGE